MKQDPFFKIIFRNPWVLLVLLGCTNVFFTCKKDTLTPARNIEGTWKASAAVKVSELSNCSTSNIAPYTSFNCIFTFIITAVDDNNVTVQVYGNAESNIDDGCGQSPPIEGGYPVTYGGRISSSSLMLVDHVYAKNDQGQLAWGDFDIGDFTFTSDILSGKIYWVQYYSSQDAIGWETEKITLSKQ